MQHRYKRLTTTVNITMQHVDITPSKVDED